jgi:hypothetical protein
MSNEIRRPIAVVEEEVLVEHRMFFLIDPDTDYWRDDPGLHPGRVVTASRHRLWLHSGGNDHYAHVRLELWVTSPPPAPHTWETRTTTALPVAGRRLCLATTVNGPVMHPPDSGHPALTAPTIHYLALPAPGNYAAEVLVNGRVEAAALAQWNWQHHVESWCIRLWATPDTTQV